MIASAPALVLLLELAASTPGGGATRASQTKEDARLAVHGLEAWDRLKIRLQPGPASPHVGDIPAGTVAVMATGRTKKVAGDLWREVEFQGVRGWVNGRFVSRRGRAAEAGPAVTGSVRAGSKPEPVFAEDLVCAGTAPVWKLVVDRDGSAAGSAGFGPGGLGDVHALPAQSQKGPGRAWSMTLEDAQGIGVVTLDLRRTDRCEVIGTNDRHSYEVAVRRPDGEVLAGCCNSKRRSPNIVVKVAPAPKVTSPAKAASSPRRVPIIIDDPYP
jgi:hypothetical protein